MIAKLNEEIIFFNLLGRNNTAREQYAFFTGEVV